MSQSNENKQRAKAHKIEVRRRPGSEGTIQTGATTQIYLDGKLLGGATFFKFEVHARKVAKVTIELLGEVEIDADVELGEPQVKPTDMTIKGKPVSLYTLSSYGPKDIAIKK